MLQVTSISRGSLTGSGAEPNGASQGPVYLADDKLVFWSAATNLVGGDTNARIDIFLKDVATGTVTRLSTSSGGVQVNGNSYTPSFSADGTVMAFYSDATNLVGGDTNNTNDVFVKNLSTGVVTRVSTGNGDVQGNGAATDASISANGNLVVFRSYANNLITGDTNGERDIFMKNLTTGITTRMSQDAGGVGGNAGSDDPVISADGSKVAFWSLASNLAAGDTNGTYDVFVKDVATGAVTIASSDASGTVGNLGSFDPVFSPDGTKVAFRTFSNNLILGDGNGASDIFVKDLTTGILTLVSSKADGFTFGNGDSFSPIFSPDGTKVAFASRASNLVSGDTNGVMDIFVKDLTTGNIIRVSRTPEGTQAFRDCFSPVWSPDGNSVAFHTLSANLVGGDTNNALDVYIAGLTPQQSVSGGSGDETHTGGAANDTIDGGGGNDSIDGGAGDDSLLGGDGNDTINGGAGYDIVDGGAGDDVLYGGTENNWLIGGDGNDSLVGGPGIDSMEGNAGNDTLEGNGGDDTLDGGADNDSLEGGAGYDSLLGGDGNDYLNGGDDSDYMDGGAGVDTLYGGTGNEIMTGGAGDDVLYGEAGTDRLVGDLGNDTLYGGADSDSMFGGAGDDSLIGGDGNDYIEGGDDNDYIEGGTGNDSLVGGNGIDTLSFATAVSGIVIDLAAGSVTSAVYGNDTVAGFEIVLGGAGNDSITGGAANETIDGGAGSDTLLGGGGIDALDYRNSLNSVNVNLATGLAVDGADTDTIGGFEIVLGGAGNDTVTGGATAETIDGGAGNDSLIGSDGDDSVFGGAGNDTFLASAGTGSDTYDGGDGNDTLSFATATQAVSVNLAAGTASSAQYGAKAISRFETVLGGSGHDAISGSSGDDYLDGGAGYDTLTGGAGNDTLVGGSSGADVLIGGDGNDVLDPGGNVDTLTGGLGADRYVFDRFYSASGAGQRDIITDFNRTQGDVIDFSRIGVTLTFIGSSAFSGTHEEVRVFTDSGNTVVEIDYNKTGTANYQIELSGIVTVTAADIVGVGQSVLQGGAAGELLIGSAGDDLIDGGGGNDTIDGGAGNDTLLGGSSGADSLLGGTGNDVLDGGSNYDTLDGGDGNDSLNGGDSNDTLIGGAGNDTLYGGITGMDSLDGGDGDDVLYGESNHDTLTGGAGNDTLYGGSGDDQIFGGDGGDRLYGESGNDLLWGGNDKDLLAGGTGNDTLDGGAGNDVGDYRDFNVGWNIDLSTGTASNGSETDTLISIETIHGSQGNDTIAGDAGINYLIGNNGNDRLAGQGGADQLLGGSGSDVFVYFALSDSTTSTTDHIQDFEDGTDLISLAGLGFTGIQLGAASGTILGYTQSGGLTTISDTGSFQIIIETTALTLTNADFIF